MSTFTITKEIQFDAGHRVPLHGSKCRNPHGHRYRVVAEVEGPLVTSGSSTDMVLDFGDLKSLLQGIHDKFDHGFIVFQEDYVLRDALSNAMGMDTPPVWKVIVVPFHPTAEKLAEYIYASISSILPAPMVLRSITVWETPTSSAKVEAS